MSPQGLLLSDDLIFTSRVVGTGRDLGLAVRSVRSAAELLSTARAQPPAGVVLDLANPGLDVAAVVSELKRLAPPPTVVAYGPHVDTALLRTARAAGCDRVLTRSQFVEQLPTHLGDWLRPANPLAKGDAGG